MFGMLHILLIKGPGFGLRPRFLLCDRTFSTQGSSFAAGGVVRGLFSPFEICSLFVIVDGSKEPQQTYRRSAALQCPQLSDSRPLASPYLAYVLEGIGIGLWSSV